MRCASLLLVLLVGGPLAPSDPPPTAEVIPPPELDIRSADGAVIVPAADILEYEWATHTMRWRPGIKDRVFRERIGELVEGSPFTVCVGDRPVYRGKFMSRHSSHSQDAVVILRFWQDAQGRFSPDDAARLQLGFPSAEFFKGVDPRSDPAVRAALKAADKLR